MVPYGTTAATVPAMTWYVSTSNSTPTGERDVWNYSHDYYRDSTPKLLDPRKNPKNWALWFREFLTSIFPVSREIAAVLSLPVSHSPLLRHCRSGPPPQREWKMKNWVQALKSQQI